MPITIWIWIILALSPVVTWGVEEVRMSWRIAGAIAATVKDQQQICNGRVAEIESKLNQAALETINQVKAAQAASKPTPIEALERQALCDADPMCRDRKKKK